MVPPAFTCCGVLLDVLVGVAHLHRAGVRPQVVRDAVVAVDVDVERVLHRAGRMVRRIVQRGEAVPVALDLRAVGHVETHAGEDQLDPLHRQADRMQAAGFAQAPGQRNVQRLGLELGLELGVGQFLSPLAQRGFDRLLGGIDRGATRLLGLDAQRTEALHQLGDAAGLAGELRLGVLQIGGRRGPGESLARARDDGIQFVSSHRLETGAKQRNQEPTDGNRG